MTQNSWRVIRLACLAAFGVGAALFLARFPWSEIPAVLARANPEILGIALVVNLSSLVAKGSAWYLLLRPASPCGWRAAQEANLLGAAMNSVSVSVIGETARVQDLAIREGIPVGRVAASVVRVRAVEALALACFMMLAPALLSLPPILHGIQVLGCGLMLALIAAAWSGRFARLLVLLPPPVRTTLSRVTETGSPPLFVAALLLALFNWVAQWATYHLVLAAFGIPITFSGSFTALIATNLSGLFRLSPGNVGVTQAALIVSLLPFGVRPHEALAAGFALQAIQILPVLALALAAIGRRELAAKVARGAAPP
jgi:uncharacterized membrane protein YbhN (UPF0104 family)